jgi:hypothetical protein
MLDSKKLALEQVQEEETAREDSISYLIAQENVPDGKTSGISRGHCTVA